MGFSNTNFARTKQNKEWELAFYSYNHKSDSQVPDLFFQEFKRMHVTLNVLKADKSCTISFNKECKLQTVDNDNKNAKNLPYVVYLFSNLLISL